jgi:hypothetical protein
MKTKFTLFSFAAALAAVTSLQAADEAVTAPVGYRTETIIGNVFNLLSSNLSNAVSAAGDVDSTAAKELIDTDVDFIELLTDDVLYSVKITLGGGLGYHTLVDSWSTDTLFTADDLSSVVTAGDSYEIRAVPTISDLFGAANEAGLQTGDADTADVVWIPAAGGFTQLFFDTDWRKVGALDFLAFPDEPVNFTDGAFVQRRGGTDLDVVFVGHVQTTETVAGVEGAGAFNYMSRVLPVSVSLGDSGLSDGLLAGDVDTGDVLWVPDGTPGGYAQYYFDTAWRKVGALDFLEFPDDLLTSGFIIQRRGDAGNVTLDIPGGLDL